MNLLAMSHAATSGSLPQTALLQLLTSFALAPSVVISFLMLVMTVRHDLRDVSDAAMRAFPALVQFYLWGPADGDVEAGCILHMKGIHIFVKSR